MHDMTESNLHDAFAGESQAHMRYKIYSAVAEEEGYQNVARLFRAIAYAERVHATNHLNRMPEREGFFSGENPYGVGNTSRNLQYGIDGETFEIEEMYPTYKKVSKFQEEPVAEQTFNWALQAEKIHAKMFKDAKESVDDEEDMELDEVQICSRCGYTTEGEAPEECPICGAKGDQFREFSD
ncbi:MAG: rubrerythrin family protein [Candidatus Hadarchaeota archaeon]